MEKAAIPFPRCRLDRLCMAVACFALALAMPGCTTNFLNQNDKLRRQVLNLNNQVAKLQRDLNLREAEIKQIQQRTTPDILKGPDAKGVEAPRVVALEFDRFSGVLGPGAERIGRDLRLYVKTKDQEDQFMPAAGRAAVQVVAIRVGKPPLVVTERAFDPIAFDQAYRSGLTGTHYTLDIPLPNALPPDVDNLTVKMAFQDAATGATIKQEAVFPVKSSMTAPAVE